MTVLLHCRADREQRWAAALRQAIPDSDVRIWPDVGDAASIEIIVAMMPFPADLRTFPHLRFVATTGAGVEHLVGPESNIPDHLPIVRVVDPMLTRSMAEYVLAAVLRYHRYFHHYEMAQRDRLWDPRPRCDPEERTIGILGLGVLGTAAGQLLAGIGFHVLGWSRRPKAVAGIECFCGSTGLNEMLTRTNILVCLLPLTANTSGLINEHILGQLPRGAMLINVGRGRQIVEVDLLAALDRGQIDHATLDVFEVEPLPPDHWFWRHPRITVTPHVASLTVPESAATGIAEALRCARAGQPVPNLVDRMQGY